jgi:cation diffusion facilitator CzcD-associated flavoprotein CzcO
MASASPCRKAVAPGRAPGFLVAGTGDHYQLHLLRDRLGLSVRVLEAAGGIGGTWYWNRYPGARCGDAGAELDVAPQVEAVGDVVEVAADLAVVGVALTAVGCLSSTNVPEIPGLARFSGAQYHTGRWPHDGRLVVCGAGDAGAELDVAPQVEAVGDVVEVAADLWTVTTESGECFEAQFLITAVGCLSSTNVPEIPGLGSWRCAGRP